MTTNAMDTLLALKCRKCLGTKLYIKGMEVPPLMRGNGDCSDCQHPVTKQPTGLLIRELVEACTGMMDEWDEEDYEIEGEEYYTSGDSVATRYYNIGPVKICKETPCTKDEQCFQCGGTGLVPVSEDTALRVALEWLLRNQGEVIVGVFGNGVEFRQGRQGYYISESNESELGEGATPLEALAAAIKASVEVENHDN